jgi:hypothetical protein
VTFASWCACHAMESRARFNALEQLLLRVRLTKERAAKLTRLWHEVCG